MAIAIEALDAARLTDSDARWEDSTAEGAFVERTTDPKQLALVLGFDCSWSGTQRTGDVERLAVAAWTGNHLSMVIQATDSPATPYRQDRTVDIMFDAPKGELVAEDTWAVTLAGGDSLILLTRNTGNFGFLAKSWLAEYAIIFGGQPAPDHTATEQMAIPALQAAEGRNVAVAEDSHGSPVSVIVLVSPSGDMLFVTVGPIDQFDAFGYLTPGEVSHQNIDGTPVRFVDPDDEYPASEAAFNCNGFGWTIGADDGDVTETNEFIVGLIDALDCQ
jgi:hypothetical protein